MRTPCNEVGSIPSEKIGLREFLTHGFSLTPYPRPVRKFKGKGQGDPKPFARERHHSYNNVSFHFELRSSVCTTIHAVLRRGVMGKELNPQRDRNPVVKENGISTHK